MTQDELRAWLAYDPRTGVLTWLKKPAKRYKIGSRAGSLRRDGYRWVVVEGMGYSEHVLIWFYMTGEWPPRDIDHKRPGFEFRADNRWSQLRLATTSQNQANRVKKLGTSSRFKGVSWKKSHAKWRAQIWVEGKGKHLGLFASQKAAHVAYASAARKEFGEFAHA